MSLTIENTLLSIFIAFFFIGLLFLFSYFISPCQPHCSGVFCGSNSDDGCGNPCSCKDGLVCTGDTCCQPKCDGLSCDSDGCGGDCSCNRIPNGLCMPDKKCCYAQVCDNYYAGPNGCGGTCGCLEGATPSNGTNSPGICSNSGTSGWKYNVEGDKSRIQQTNTSSALECSKWIPIEPSTNLLNFPCSSNEDCPFQSTCVQDPNNPNNKFCSRNNVYQYWYYDPSDPQHNCTKILKGTAVCGVQKAGASGFDVLRNVGPDQSQCGQPCTVSPQFPRSGVGAECPNNWSTDGETCTCKSTVGSSVEKCCLDKRVEGQENVVAGGCTEYNLCLAKGLPKCEDLTDVSLIANIAEINSTCGGTSVVGSLSVNRENVDSTDFTEPCSGKDISDSCTYNKNGVSYTGVCKSCSGSSLSCFPNQTCQSTSMYSGPGICTTRGFC